MLESARTLDTEQPSDLANGVPKRGWATVRDAFEESQGKLPRRQAIRPALISVANRPDRQSWAVS